MTIGEKIIQIRKAAGLSQEQFGELFHVSRQSVSKWENNQTLPETQTLIQLCNTFHLSLDEFLIDKATTVSTPSINQMMHRKHMFQFGCLLTSVATCLLLMTIFIHRNEIVWYGNVIEWIAQGVYDPFGPFLLIWILLIIILFFFGIILVFLSFKHYKY